MRWVGIDQEKSEDVIEQFEMRLEYHNRQIIFDELSDDEESVMSRKALDSNIAATERTNDCLVFLKIFENDGFTDTKLLLIDPKISLRDQLCLPNDWRIIFEPGSLHLINDDERIIIK